MTKETEREINLLDNIINELTDERDELRAEVEQYQWLLEQAKTMREENMRMRKALKKYANKKNWHRNQQGQLNIFHKDTNGPFIAVDAILPRNVDTSEQVQTKL